MLLKANKLNIKFINPNTYEETLKAVSELLAEVAVSRVMKARAKDIDDTKNTG